MNADIVSADWDPKKAADIVLENLVKVNLPIVKGAHDSHFLIAGGKAYIVYMANDVQPGESPWWPFVYNALTIVDIESKTVEKTITFAATEKEYENETLPVGACFVPRIIQKDDNTLRCYFSSEDPETRQSQMWYIDFNISTADFDWNIYQVEIETDQGIFPMQPKYFYEDAVAKGFTGGPVNIGPYMIDGFKRFDNTIYTVLNNYGERHSSLAVLSDSLDRVSVLGRFFLPNEAHLSESVVNRMPDGSWCAVSRQENRDQNYMFSTSKDGKEWTENVYRDVIKNGTTSKPALECFENVYYLGWQEATQINGAFRSVFNVDVSRDGENWERKYRFESENSFQYPMFKEYEGSVYLIVTQGDSSDELKERIMFGKLE